MACPGVLFHLALLIPCPPNIPSCPTVLIAAVPPSRYLPAQERVLHMAGFFCCKRVKEGEDGGVGYAQYFADPTPARRALLRALGGPGG